MKPQLLEILQCPAVDCLAPDLTLESRALETIQYKHGAVEEVKEGSIRCGACGREYPIAEYVPVFDQLFPAPLKSEADFWSDWYGFMWDKRHFGYFDIREDVAPFLTSGVGVLDPGRQEHRDVPGIHSMLEEHPLIQPAKDLLEIGCGTGWNTLHFARRGHNIVAFDPAARSVQLAKRYAIQQGEYIEYICAAQGFLSFRPEVFDGVIAFHSLHHIPQLKDELRVVRSWMKDGAAIAVDEHIRNDPTLQAVRQALLDWADAELFPRYRDHSQEYLQGLPTAGHSELEGAGSEDVIRAVLDSFELTYFSSRFFALDSYSFLQYLAQDLDTPIYFHASLIIDRLYKLFTTAFPERVELATLIAVKREGAVADEEHDAFVKQALVAAGGIEPSYVEILQRQIDHLHEVVADMHEVAVDLHGVITAKNRQITQLEAWALDMERALSEQQQLLDQVKNGRVMRLLNSLNGKGKSS